MNQTDSAISARNCVECGDLFLSSGHTRCSKCLEKEDENFQIVRAFLRGKTNATVEEIHEGTGVDRSAIIKFLREGRLVSDKVTGEILSCEVCGRPVRCGRLCEACLRTLESKAGLGRRTCGSPSMMGERVAGRMYSRRRHPQ